LIFSKKLQVFFVFTPSFPQTIDNIISDFCGRGLLNQAALHKGSFPYPAEEKRRNPMFALICPTNFRHVGWIPSSKVGRTGQKSVWRIFQVCKWPLRGCLGRHFTFGCNWMQSVIWILKETATININGGTKQGDEKGKSSFRHFWFSCVNTSFPSRGANAVKPNKRALRLHWRDFTHLATASQLRSPKKNVAIIDLWWTGHRDARLTSTGFVVPAVCTFKSEGLFQQSDGWTVSHDTTRNSLHLCRTVCKHPLKDAAAGIVYAYSSESEFCWESVSLWKFFKQD
jgi:hypothetical protein